MIYTLSRDMKENIEVMQTSISEIGMHFHNHFIEIAYVCSGNAEHSIGSYDGAIQAGNYFIIDYDTPHRYVSHGKNLSIINCLFLPQFVDPAFADVKNFNELCERYYFKISGRRIKGPASNLIFSDDGSVGELFHKMHYEYDQKQESYIEILRHLLCMVIIETIRKVGSDNNISHVTAAVIKEINNSFSQKLTLSDICLRLNYSLSYISSRFLKETGFTFTQFLQNRRIEEGCRLLSDTSLSVAAIAEKVGYDSIKFFNKVFKQVTGLTPREFRKQKK